MDEQLRYGHLTIGKVHQSARTFHAVVFDSSNRNEILFRASVPGWTKERRDECRRWIAENGLAKMQYEAWIEGPQTRTRIVPITATGIQAAHDQAVAMCADSEFVRGVTPVEDKSAAAPPWLPHDRVAAMQEP